MEESIIDFQPIETALTQVKTAVTSFVTDNIDVFLSIVGAFFVLGLVFLVFKWIKRASNRS